MYSLHEGVQFSLAAEVNHAPGSYVYTMEVLYGEISTWPTKQLVDLSRRYVSTKHVRRLLTEQLVEVTLFYLPNVCPTFTMTFGPAG